jgi:hypothetical protein
MSLPEINTILIVLIILYLANRRKFGLRLEFRWIRTFGKTRRKYGIELTIWRWYTGTSYEFKWKKEPVING